MNTLEILEQINKKLDSKRHEMSIFHYNLRDVKLVDEGKVKECKTIQIRLQQISM